MQKKKKHFCEILKWFILKHVEDFLLEKAILFYILTTELFIMFSIIDQWYFEINSHELIIITITTIASAQGADHWVNQQNKKHKHN